MRSVIFSLFVHDFQNDFFQKKLQTLSSKVNEHVRENRNLSFRDIFRCSMEREGSRNNEWKR